MNRDLARQVSTVVAVLATFAANTAAIAIPLGGRTTQQISDSYRVYVIPSGGTFAVWGVIYTLLLAFAIYQALPRTRESEALRRIGWLPLVSCAFNAGWIFLWQYEFAAASLVAMLGLLVTLIAIRERTRGLTGRAERWLIAIPFSVYLGWITVATVLNVAVALVSLGVTNLGGLEPTLTGGLVLVVAIAIAAGVTLRERDAGYGLVVLWAFWGILAKEGATPYVGVVATAGLVIVAVSVLVVLARTRLRAGGGLAPA